jgi:hypothetical protein
MKKLIFLIQILFLFSCSNLYKSGYSATPDNLTIQTPPLKAELIVDKDKTLQGYSETVVFLGIFIFGDNKFSDSYGGDPGDREKKAATYKALDGTGYDIIVNPKYIIKIRRGLFIRTISATSSFETRAIPEDKL